MASSRDKTKTEKKSSKSKSKEKVAGQTTQVKSSKTEAKVVKPEVLKAEMDASVQQSGKILSEDVTVTKFEQGIAAFNGVMKEINDVHTMLNTILATPAISEDVKKRVQLISERVLPVINTKLKERTDTFKSWAKSCDTAEAAMSGRAEKLKSLSSSLQDKATLIKDDETQRAILARNKAYLPKFEKLGTEGQASLTLCQTKIAQCLAKPTLATTAKTTTQQPATQFSPVDKKPKKSEEKKDERNEEPSGGPG